MASGPTSDTLAVPRHQAMTLLGRSAWWLPRPLERLLPELDVEGRALGRRLEEATSGPAPPVRR
jgi:RND superfamily putative drug exporter